VAGSGERLDRHGADVARTAGDEDAHQRVGPAGSGMDAWCHAEDGPGRARGAGGVSRVEGGAR
jgi:hypothetical protein